MRDLKIIARLFGGIGSQLFIYAAARRLAMLNNSELVLDHVRGFTRDADYQRHYQLVHLNIHSRKASESEGLYLFNRFRRKILRSWNQSKSFEQRTYRLQESIDFHPQLLAFKPRGALYLGGYWHSEHYFNDAAATLHYVLQIKPEFDAASHLQQYNVIS